MALLEGAIDYAGLFPPAALPVTQVLDHYRTYLESPERFALGRLIWPAARLQEVADPAFPSCHISALLSHPEELALVEQFNARRDLRIKVDSLETRWSGPDSLTTLERWGYWLFFEVSAVQAAEVAAQLKPSRWALKLRCGGLKTEDFPDSSTIYRFLQACRAHSKPFKFTAGLHHAGPGVYPLNYEAQAPRAAMQGFLNLLVASALVWHGKVDEAGFAALLSLDPAEMDWQPARLTWGEHRLTLEEFLRFRREGARGFGSCSFCEPIGELKALEWL